jgi:aspartate aminotransferase-like enzyme
MSEHLGHHFLQIPGPSPVPERVLRAIAAPVIDHRSPEFGRLGRQVLDGCQQVFVGPRNHLPFVRHRRLGGGDCQYALARR